MIFGCNGNFLKCLEIEENHGFEALFGDMPRTIRGKIDAMRRKCTLLLVLLLLLPSPAVAQDKGPNYSWTFAISLENDWFFAHTDRYYTNGLRLTWISPELTDLRELSWVPNWSYPFIKRLPSANEPAPSQAISLSVGQNMYTPEDKEQTNTIQDDRPYAGFTYVAAGFHSKSSRHLDSLEFALGIVGPHSYAGDVQTKVHELIDSPIPNGWDNQLEDEAILNIFYGHKWKPLRSEVGSGLGYDVIPHAGGALGNALTSVGAGVQVRFGWNLPNDFGIYHIHPGYNIKTELNKQGSHLPTGHRAFGIHLFSSLDGYAVARNIFLDGNTFRESYHVDKKPLVAEFMVGLGMTFSRFKVNFANVAQTKEFQGQREHQKFGSITFSFSF